MKKNTFHISFHLPVASLLLSIAAPAQNFVLNSNADQALIVKRFLNQFSKYKILHACGLELAFVKFLHFLLNIFSLSKKLINMKQLN
jgi:hypothetical protein